jgi:hypothetical protein
MEYSSKTSIINLVPCRWWWTIKAKLSIHYQIGLEHLWIIHSLIFYKLINRILNDVLNYHLNTLSLIKPGLLAFNYDGKTCMHALNEDSHTYPLEIDDVIIDSHIESQNPELIRYFFIVICCHFDLFLSPNSPKL